MGLYNMLMPCNTKLLNHIILKRCEYQNKNPNPNTSNNIKGFTNDTLKTYGYRDTDVLSYTVVLYKSNNLITVVLYKSNNLITIQKVEAGDAIISFGFTGCTLASFTYKGQLYAAHIPPGQVGTWDQAVGKNENGIVVVNRFIPKVQGWSEGRLKGNYPNNRCWGIIENDGKMYSLIVYENIQYEYDDKAAKYQYKLNDASSIINIEEKYSCCSIG